MTFLIDAYNLMHAVGYLSPKTPLNRMESSRRRLIDWLADHLRSRPGDRIHVVFDAKTAPKPSPDSLVRGVTVSFAFGESADDYIAANCRRVLGPTTVVTNDSVVAAEAKRAGVAVLACSAFVDELLRKAVEPIPAAEVEKPAIDESDLLEAFSTPKAKPRRSP
jgi:predicted RNA-binding protein with PIN domain